MKALRLMHQNFKSNQGENSNKIFYYYYLLLLLMIYYSIALHYDTKVQSTKLFYYIIVDTFK
jgi:hypothetical protein